MTLLRVGTDCSCMEAPIGGPKTTTDTTQTYME